MAKLKSANPTDKELGTAVYLIDHLALRAGTEKDTDESADTVGCCSLRVEHLTLDTNGAAKKVTLDFLGKDSIRYHNTVEVHELVFASLQKLCTKKLRDDMIFTITPTQVNNYLSGFLRGLTGKVFRTYNASITLQQELGKFEEKLQKNGGFMTDVELLQFYNDANRQVAILCNHQRSVPKGHEDQIEQMKERVASQRKALKEVQRELASEEDDDKIGKLKSKLDKMKASLKRQETQLSIKDRNKSVALGTSKINYMDPRITVVFCKTVGLEINKVFTKSLLEKFPWAMYTKTTWRF